MAMIIGSLFSQIYSKQLSPEEIMTRLKSISKFDGIGGEVNYQDSQEAGPHYHYPVVFKKDHWR